MKTKNHNTGPTPKEEYKIQDGYKCNQCFETLTKGDWGYVCYETGQFACTLDCEEKMSKEILCYSITYKYITHIHVKVIWK